MIDPNTADVTARVLEMLGSCNLSIDADSREKAISYLIQDKNRKAAGLALGVNYIYGTSGVLAALSLISPKLITRVLNEVRLG